MKLLIQAAMVFFATLLAAALVALGAPMIAELVTRSEPPPVVMATASPHVLASTDSRSLREATVPRPGR